MRVAEFDALFAASLLEVRRHDADTRVRLVLAGDETLPGRVQGLVDAESSCCSFFDFSVTEGGGEVLLDIAVPAAYGDVLAGLVARAAAALGE